MGRKQDALFRVTPFEAKTISWWRTRRQKIDMEPPYQRKGRLWSSTDKGYLIDSILNGFDIPKLYVADFSWGNSTLNRKRLPYAIIDGKQRLEAIFDFYDGTITLNDDFSLRENPKLALAGLGYQDLLANHAEVAEAFDTYNLSVMSVMSSSEALINELFVRLNRSKPLTGAEVRNAMSGPAPALFREIASHAFFDAYVTFGAKRGQDLNTASKLLMFEYKGDVTETKKRNMDAFTREVKSADRKNLELAVRRVLDALDVMTSVFLPGDKLLASSGTVPVYYWFVRSLSEAEQQKAREFLVDFERRRKDNRRLAEHSPGSRKIEADLVAFDNYNRNTNDVQSHQERYRILKAWLKQYMRKSE